MSALEKYATYRKLARELHTRIMQTCLNRDALMQSARLLGIAQGTTIVFGSVGEEYALMDFALHEYRNHYRNAIGVYYDLESWHSEVEKEILDGLMAAYTSLFRVISISATERTLLLQDVFSVQDVTRLTDIGFSRTAGPGLLLFTRLVPCREFTMTSGFAFVFAGELESYLLKQYRSLAKTVESDRESVRRQVAFFQLNRTDGMEIRYE